MTSLSHTKSDGTAWTLTGQRVEIAPQWAYERPSWNAQPSLITKHVLPLKFSGEQGPRCSRRLLKHESPSPDPSPSHAHCPAMAFSLAVFSSTQCFNQVSRGADSGILSRAWFRRHQIWRCPIAAAMKPKTPPPRSYFYDSLVAQRLLKYSVGGDCVSLASALGQLIAWAIVVRFVWSPQTVTSRNAQAACGCASTWKGSRGTPHSSQVAYHRYIAAPSADISSTSSA